MPQEGDQENQERPCKHEGKDSTSQPILTDKWFLQKQLPFTPPLQREKGLDEERWPRHLQGDDLVLSVKAAPFYNEEARGDAISVAQVGRNFWKIKQEIFAQINQFESIFDAIPDGVLVYDSEEQLLFTNTVARELFARNVQHEYWRRPAGTGGSLQYICNKDGDWLPHERWPLTRILCGEHIPAIGAEDIVLRTPDGHQLLMRQSGAPLYSVGGYIIGGVLISRDVTEERRQMEDRAYTEPEALKEIEQLKQDLAALKESEQLKDDFIATAAHELCSPLTALVGYAGMLEQQTSGDTGPDLAEWQVEALEAIAQDAKKLANLTNDLLDVTQLQAGKFQLHCYPTDLVALSQRVVTRLRLTAKDHTLMTEMNAQRIMVTIDIQRIEQVLTNLLSNAIKYSPVRSTIVLAARENPEGSVAELAVRDQGIGIPAHQQRHIFSRFFRADNARALGIDGTGLGLHLCRELVELHHGHIWFESVQGHGSTFYASLPLDSGQGS